VVGLTSCAGRAEASSEAIEERANGGIEEAKSVKRSFCGRDRLYKYETEDGTEANRQAKKISDSKVSSYGGRSDGAAPSMLSQTWP
jgi:hypothetical protein